MFAEAIENEQATTTTGKFMGQVTLAELRSHLMTLQRQQMHSDKLVIANHVASS